MEIRGKAFVVTGAGAGIGREVVLALLARGARVAGVDRSVEGLAETVGIAAAGSSLITVPLDITDRAAVEALPAQVTAAFGQVDGLVNVAGIIQPFVRINDLDYAAIERVMNVNFWGVVNMTKTFLPLLLARPVAHIANVSSMGAYAPVPGQTAYGASKAAVKLFSEGLYAELLDTHVGVTVIFPGATATNIAGNSGIDMKAPAGDTKGFAMTQPTETARLIVEGIEQNRYHVFAGKDARTMDRLARYLPNRVAKIVYKQMKSLLSQTS